MSVIILVQMLSKPHIIPMIHYFFLYNYAYIVYKNKPYFNTSKYILYNCACNNCIANHMSGRETWKRGHGAWSPG